MPHHILLPLMILSSSIAVPVSADSGRVQDDDPRSEIRPARATTAPAIDGVLDDGVWGAAPIAEPFITYNPTRGDILPQRTDVWVAFDDENLYFAFRCYDSEPEHIRSTITQRDNIFADDWVGISLDALGNRQTSYDLFVNPNGIQGDILNSSVSGEDIAPDFVWESAGRVTADGYEVEMRIPLRSIRFRSGRDVTMGILFWRRISRLGLSGSWPELEAGTSIFTCNAPLQFDELRSPLLLELLPAWTWGLNREKADAGSWNGRESSRDLGIGVKYGLTSSITAEATWNPDFSQVESDAFQAEVNQRYPVFYEEKRPFFMEGTDIFGFAHIGHGYMGTALHTRNIVDPLWGGKVTGSLGSTSFGILAAGDEFPGYPGVDTVNPHEGERAQFLVGRGKYSLGRDDYVGLIYASRTFAERENRVVGADTRFRFGERHTATVSLLGSTTATGTGPEVHGTSIHTIYSYGSRSFATAFAFEHYDRTFAMDTAFLTRTGVDNGWVFISPTFYPGNNGSGWLLRWGPEFVLSRTYDRFSGQTDHFHSLALTANTVRQGNFRFEYSLSREWWQGRAFDQKTMVTTGGIQLQRWLALNAHAVLTDGIYYRADPAFAGKVRSVGFGFALQPNSRFTQQFSFGHDHFRRADNGTRVYEVNIAVSRTTYQFNRYFFIRGLVQYDSSRRRLLTDFLASFTLIPGTVMHLGYGSIYDRGQWEASGFVPGPGSLNELRRGIFFKASYLWRM